MVRCERATSCRASTGLFVRNAVKPGFSFEEAGDRTAFAVKYAFWKIQWGSDKIGIEAPHHVEAVLKLGLEPGAMADGNLSLNPQPGPHVATSALSSVLSAHHST